MKFQVWLFAGLCIVIGQAQAALFSDDEAHNQIRQLKESLSTLESAGKQQVETIKQQAHFISDLQTEIDVQKTELRKLHGQNEEHVHNLKDTEKRLTNLYSDHEKSLLSLRGQYEKLMLNFQDAEKRQSEANKKQASFIQDQQAQLKVYRSKIEESSKQQAEASKNQVEIIKQQTSSLLTKEAQFNEHMSHLEENGKQQLNAMLDQQQAQFKIRISQLEEMSKLQINSILDQQQAEFKVTTSRLEESGKQQTQAMLGLQGQIEAQNAEFRKLQGLNEDLDHRLQDANQRQKDVYTDLDTRIRHFEAVSPLELQKQIQALNEELHKLRSHNEEILTHNLQDMEKRQVEANKLQISSMLDLQKNIEAKNTELHSQNEELMHNLQEIEKKQKNFNSDLNSRLRHVETIAVLDLKKKVEAQDDEASQLRGQNEELIHTVQEVEKRQAEISKQQISSVHKLQAQVDALNMELRRLRSQNEDLLRNLQDAEKRQKDFYIDMDASLRHFESIVAGTSSAPSASQPTKTVGGENAPSSSFKAVNGNALETDTATMENRAYGLAHGHVKAGNHQNAINAFQEFLKKYPESKHVANIHYEMGNAYFSLKDYKSALDSYRLLVSKYPSSPDVPDAMLSIADSQHQLKALVGAKKTLNQIIAKYPGSKIADQAKKRLDALK